MSCIGYDMLQAKRRALAELPRAVEPLFGCPYCGCGEYFGPATIITDCGTTEVQYVDCRRCHQPYVVAEREVRPR